MSVIFETSQSAMGPYVAMAAVGSVSYSWTAVFRAALVVKVAAGDEGDGGGEGGEGGEGGDGGGGGERGGKGGEGGGEGGGASWWMVTSVFVHAEQYARHVARPCGGEDESSELMRAW